MIKARLLLPLLIAALLCVQMLGVHVHLCFDGSEPAVSFQTDAHDWAEDTGHASHQTLQQDIDVNLVGETLLPPDKVMLGLALLVTFAFLLPLPRRTRSTLRIIANVIVPLAPARIRPPLRAPPL